MQTITTYPPPPGEADPLNAEIDDEIYIDTKDLCKRVAYELKVSFSYWIHFYTSFSATLDPASHIC
jgi:hypothetical protein